MSLTIKFKTKGQTGSGLFAFLFVLWTSTYFATSMVEQDLQMAKHEICDLIEDNYYAPGPELDQWLPYCRHLAEIPLHDFSKTGTVNEMNQILRKLDVSHLHIFDPDANRQVWENSGFETGLRLKMISGLFFVSFVLPASPAHDAGILPGDQVLKLDGRTNFSEFELRTSGGQYQLLRDEDIFTRELEVRDVEENLGPKFEWVSRPPLVSAVDLNNLKSLDQGIGLIRLQSFLPQYFKGNLWTEVYKRAQNAAALVVDVRGNSGGSFPAMLTSLSAFFCERTTIGKILQPRLQPDGDVTQMEYSIEVDRQLELLAVSKEIRLTTFPQAECLRQPIIVLVDRETASTAEVFAEAMRMRKSNGRVEIWGEQTAGEVVLARWFSISNLGGGDYAISIPIASFETTDGRVIEAEGVTPEKLIYDDVDAARAGVDNGMKMAAEYLYGIRKKSRLGPAVKPIQRETIAPDDSGVSE